MNAPIPQDQLPSWDLSGLYPGLDSPELKRDLEKAAAEAKEFAAKYETKMASLSGAEMAEALKRFEALQELLGPGLRLTTLTDTGPEAEAHAALAASIKADLQEDDGPAAHPDGA